MQWFRRLRLLILGVVLVVVAFMWGGFDTVSRGVITVLFAVLGAAVVALMAWVIVRDYRRQGADQRDVRARSRDW